MHIIYHTLTTVFSTTKLKQFTPHFSYPSQPSLHWQVPSVRALARGLRSASITLDHGITSWAVARHALRYPETDNTDLKTQGILGEFGIPLFASRHWKRKQHEYVRQEIP